jgi:hypothetical protein
MASDEINDLWKETLIPILQKPLGKGREDKQVIS